MSMYLPLFAAVGVIIIVNITMFKIFNPLEDKYKCESCGAVFKSDFKIAYMSFRSGCKKISKMSEMQQENMGCLHRKR